MGARRKSSPERGQHGYAEAIRILTVRRRRGMENIISIGRRVLTRPSPSKIGFALNRSERAKGARHLPGQSLSRGPVFGPDEGDTLVCFCCSDGQQSRQWRRVICGETECCEIDSGKWPIFCKAWNGERVTGGERETLI